MFAPESHISKVQAAYGRTIQEILAKEGEYDAYEILGAVETLIGRKISQKIQTSPAERMVFGFVWLVAEVQNGGFHQYFANSAGDFWKDVLYGLEAIDDQAGLSLFRDVLSNFPGSAPAEDRDARLTQLEELEEANEKLMWERFAAVSNRYFQTPFPKWQLLFDYIKAHPEQFDLGNA